MNKNLNAGITMLLVGVGKFMQDARLMVREELVELVGLVLWCVVGTKSPDVGLGSCANEEVAKCYALCSLFSRHKDLSLQIQPGTRFQPSPLAGPANPGTRDRLGI